MAVLLNTSLGDIVIDLHTDLCPRTCKNFLKLCKIKYYGNCLFHDVKRDFIAQTGDPTGKGTGGDSVYKYLYGDQARFFDDEFHPNLKHDKIGTVAMASAGENLNASQFYITLRYGLNYLDGKHTVFGEVAEGLETLLRINEAFVDDNGRPYKNIRIKHVDVLDDPFEDSPELEELIPEQSPDIRPPAEGEEVRLEDDWVPMDEKMGPEELDKSIRKKEAQSRAVVLEMIGDIPEAEVKPPENVLFICKLNPVTEEGDLETIFSRFGNIISADIIRDYKTGDSLCYGFIEFENKESCEAAYFKMDNVLIDDRRVHVDFSQSVSKLWTRFRKFGSKDTEESGRGHGQAIGGGCYNCEEFGHLKKDCPKVASGEGIQGTEALAKPKYTLKESTGQRGTSGNRYEMVFDGDEEFDRDADRSFERPSKRYRERTNHQRRTTSSEERLNDQHVSSVEGERRSHKHMYRREDADEYSRRRSGPSASSQGILDTDSRREGRSRDGRWDGQRGESPPSSRRNPESRRENSRTAERSRENKRGDSSDLGETLTKAEFPSSARGRPHTKGGHFGKIDQSKKNHGEEDSAFGRDKRSGRRSLSPQAHRHDGRRRHRKEQLESEDDKQTGALDPDMRCRQRSPPRQAHRHDDGRRRTDGQLESEEDKQFGARSASPVRKRGSITRRSPSRHMDDEDVPCRRSPPSVKERRRGGREYQRGGRRERDSPDNYSRRQRRSDEIDLPRERYGDERSHHDKRTRRNKRSSREEETEWGSQKY